MKILNIHERYFRENTDHIGPLLDSLASRDDRLWPHEHWPPMVLDRPLGPGADGGHGPGRYRVSEYRPGKRVSFFFEERGMSRGFHGGHYFEVRTQGERAGLRHVIEMEVGPVTFLRWLFLIRPLHDALLEDALDKVENGLTGRVSRPARWSLWVRLLRRALALGKRRGD